MLLCRQNGPTALALYAYPWAVENRTEHVARLHLHIRPRCKVIATAVPKRLLAARMQLTAIASTPLIITTYSPFNVRMFTLAQLFLAVLRLPYLHSLANWTVLASISCDRSRDTPENAPSRTSDG